MKYGTSIINNDKLSKLLLKEIFNFEDKDILVNKEITKYQEKKYKNYIVKLKNGEPIQYLLGKADFYGYEFFVNKYVLIPRFETEVLVQSVIEYANTHFKAPNIIDLGSGSGIIGITIKKEIPNAKVTCLDIDKNALNITQKNSQKLGVVIKTIKGNMLDDIKEKYDIIVSNPPYIDEKEEIEPIVYNNEPHLALFAPTNGLYYYEQILKKAQRNLNPKSLIAFEIGCTQAKQIVEIGKKYFPKAEYVIKKDLTNRDRYVFILNNM